MNNNLELSYYLSILNNEKLLYKDYHELIILVANDFANNQEDLKKLITVGFTIVNNMINKFKLEINKVEIKAQIIKILIIEFQKCLQINKNIIISEKCFQNEYTPVEKFDTLSDFEKQYILYKYGLYDGKEHSSQECFYMFDIEKHLGKLLEEKMLKKLRLNYFSKLK